MSAELTWFNVWVEHKPTGIHAVHQVQAVHPTDAADHEYAFGFTPLWVEVHGRNDRWPNLPNYVGRY